MKRIIGAIAVSICCASAPALAHEHATRAESLSSQSQAKEACPAGKTLDQSITSNISNTWRGFLAASDIGKIHHSAGLAEGSGTGGSGAQVKQHESNWDYMKHSWNIFRGQAGLTRSPKAEERK